MVALTLRSAGVAPKNAPLNNSEIDNNFISLDQGIGGVAQDLALAKTANLNLAEQLRKLKVRLMLAL